MRIQEQIEEQNTLEEKQYERVYNEELVEANGENVAD